MRFLIDAQLPPALAEWLRDRGHEAQHVSNALDIRATDDAIVELARRDQMVIVTKDSDFADLIESPPPFVLWVRVGNTSTRQLLGKLNARWAELVRRLEASELIVELD